MSLPLVCAVRIQLKIGKQLEAIIAKPICDGKKRTSNKNTILFALTFLILALRDFAQAVRKAEHV